MGEVHWWPEGGRSQPQVLAPTGVVVALEEVEDSALGPNSSLLHSEVVRDQEPEWSRSREVAGDWGPDRSICPLWAWWWWKPCSQQATGPLGRLCLNDELWPRLRLPVEDFSVQVDELRGRFTERRDSSSACSSVELPELIAARIASCMFCETSWSSV